NTLGRLTTPEQFGDIIVKAGTNPPPAQQSPTGMAAPATTSGQGGPNVPRGTGAAGGQADTGAPPATRTLPPRDRARVELGSQQYEQSATLDGRPSVALPIYQLPGSNALDTAAGVDARMKELKSRFPDGLDYRIVYDTTPFIRQSIGEVFSTLRDAI